jgi:hypothetical protein
MAPPTDGAKGLFASLFDFNFTSFITLKFLKVIYALLMGLIFLAGIIVFFGSLLSGTAGGVLFGLFIVPILVVVYLLILRVYLESLALFFRIGENTQAIRQSLGGPGNGGFGAYAQPGQPPMPPVPPQQPPGGPMPSWAQQPPQAPPQPPAAPSQSPPQQPGFPPPGGQQ